MVALLVVGAIMTGCSNDDNIDNPQQPANNDNVVTLTAIVSLDGSAQTRAIDTGTGMKTFETSNKIAIIYKNTSNETVKAVSGALTLSGLNQKATFTVSLTNPADNSAIRYIYPATMAKDVATDATITDNDATIDYSGLFGSQNGNLATVGTNYDLAVRDDNLSGTDLPASATLNNPLAVCKFTLTDGSSPITSSVTSLNVSDGTNTYHVTPSGLSAIWVAMKPVASKKIAFTAATGSKTYSMTTESDQTLNASKLYNNITVSMIELAIGNVICSDGSIYASKADATTAGKTPVALIAYLGGDAETSTTYNHGLALALEDVSSTKTWCSQHNETCLGTQYDSESDAKGDMAGIANTDSLYSHAGHTHAAANAARDYSVTRPAGTSAWFLPSVGQWNNMITAAGGHNNLKTNAGLNIDNAYWLSSEGNAQKAWYSYLGDGSWTKSTKDSNSFRIRAYLAF